jgi:hypothetical protein
VTSLVFENHVLPAAGLSAGVESCVVHIYRQVQLHFLRIKKHSSCA